MFEARLADIWRRLTSVRPEHASVPVIAGEQSSYRDGKLQVSTRYAALQDDVVAFAMVNLVLVDFVGRTGAEMEPKINERISQLDAEFFETGMSKWATFKATARMVGLYAGIMIDSVRSAVRASRDIRDVEAALIRDGMAWIDQAGFNVEGAVAYYAYWSQQPERKAQRRKRSSSKPNVRVLRFSNDEERLAFASEVVREMTA